MDNKFINNELKSVLLKSFYAQEDYIIDDLVMIEDVIEIIEDLEHKKDFYKELKTKRVNVIDMETAKCDDQINFLKNTIVSSMENKNEKTLNFPGIGRVLIKNTTGKWDIIDEEELIKSLKEKGLDKNCISIVEKVNKKELNSLLCQNNVNGIKGIAYLEGSNTLVLSKANKNKTIVNDNTTINHMEVILNNNENNDDENNENNNVDTVVKPYFDELQ